MKSLEYLLQLHPDKTAKEILAIQAKEKADDDKQQKLFYKKQLDFIKDLNSNGGYYKGRFGADQRFYYKITNVTFAAGNIYADVEKIVVFLGVKNGSVQKGDIHIEKTTKIYQNLQTYDLDNNHRTTKTDYEKLCKYLEDIAKFWKDIKKV